MGKGIQIPLVADVKGFIKGTDDIADALDDVGGSLDDLARDSKTSGGHIESDLKSIATQGEASGDKLERKFRDVFDTAKTEAKQAGDDVGAHTERGMKKGADATAEFKSEASANFSEVASSFTGDMSQAADGVQGLMGGLAGALPGPAGIAAGVLAGIGGAMLSSFSANAEASQERIKTMYDDMLESGDNFLSEQAVRDSLSAIYSDTGERAISWNNLQKVVEATGISESVVARAYAGDTDARRQLMQGVTDAQTANNAKAISGSRAEQAATMDVANELGRIKEGVVGVADEQDKATTKVVGYRNAVMEMSGVTQSEQRAIKGGYDNFPREVTTTVKVVADLTDAKRAVAAWVPSVLINPQLRPGYYLP